MLCKPPPGLSDEELQEHVNLFFDDAPSSRNAAKSLCFQCPDQPDCLRKGLHEPSGIWGGLAEGERRSLVELLDEKGFEL